MWLNVVCQLVAEITLTLCFITETTDVRYVLNLQLVTIPLQITPLEKKSGLIHTQIHLGDFFQKTNKLY